MNTFTLGAQIGGPNVPNYITDQEQQLRNAFNAWTGDYTNVIREFAFILRVDGAIHCYTKMWGMVGPQKAKRKRDWLEVEIGVPEDWWRENQGLLYKSHLTSSIDKGLSSMVEFLQRNRHSINDIALLQDWDRIKTKYLGNTR